MYVVCQRIIAPERVPPPAMAQVGGVGIHRSISLNAMQHMNREVAMNLLRKWLSLIGLTLLTSTAFAGGSQSNVTVTGVQAGQAGPSYGTGPFCHTVFSRLRG